MNNTALWSNVYIDKDLTLGDSVIIILAAYKQFSLKMFVCVSFSFWAFWHTAVPSMAD